MSIAALCGELEALANERAASAEVVEVNFEEKSLHGEIQALEKERDRVEKELQERKALLMYSQGGVDVEKVLRQAIRRIRELEEENAELKKGKKVVAQGVALSRQTTAESRKKVPQSVTAAPQACKLGLTVSFDSSRGVTITDVIPTSSAHTAGLRVSDVVLQFNRTPTRTLMEYKRVLKSLKFDTPVRIQIRRKTATDDGKETPLWLTVDPKADPAPVPVLPLHTLPLAVAIKEREIAMRKVTKTQSKPKAAAVHQFNRRL